LAGLPRKLCGARLAADLPAAANNHLAANLVRRWLDYRF